MSQNTPPAKCKKEDTDKDKLSITRDRGFLQCYNRFISSSRN